MRRAIIILSTALFASSLLAQELNCNVSVISPQVQGSNREVYESMRKAIYEFVNTRNWTDHIYKEQERIQCQLMFNITERISDDEFQGNLQIQSSRPVFNTSLTTIMFNHRDNDIRFKFNEFEPMIQNENMFTSNLVSIVAFYVNIILGLDYDSFSPEGGTLFFQRAEAIVTNAQNAQESGWRAFENTRNRYWLVENLMNDRYRSMRSCLYRYHRLGLDRMSERPDESRSEITEAITELQPAYRENPTAMIFQVFFTAKSDEILNIYSQSFPDERNRVVTVLKEIDPANTAKWDRIIKSGN